MAPPRRVLFHVGTDHWLGPNRGPRAAADFNGDGHQDVAFLDPHGRVAVSLGQGDGSLHALLGAGPFHDVASFAVGLSPCALVAADLNGDGHVDLASANSESNDLSVLLGKGDGSFSPELRYPVGSTPLNLLATDLTGDGSPDLVVVRNSPPNAAVGRGEIVVLTNKGGTFAPFALLNPGAKLSVESASAADLDADGHVDLILGGRETTTANGLIMLWINKGNLAFAAPRTYTVNNYSASPRFALGDINGDQILDVVAVDTHQVTTLLGAAKGTLQADKVTELSAWSGLNGIVWTPLLSELDADGHLDLAMLDGFGLLSVQLGDGHGTFGPLAISAIPAYSAQSIVFADFDGDGLQDAEAGAGVHKNTGAGVLLPPTAGNFMDGSLPVDLDGDSQVELLRTFDTPELIRLRESDGTFSSPFSLPPESARIQATGDLNGDGRIDVLVSDGLGGFPAPAVLLNQGNGSFTAPVRYPLTFRVYPTNDVGLPVVRLRDFDRDGKPDLVALNAADGTVSVLLNGGQGTFGPEASYPIEDAHTRTFSYGDLVAADFDGDGACDLVVTYQPSGAAVLLMNDGHGRFGPSRRVLEQPYDSYLRSLWMEPVGAADLDGDGFPELVIGGDRELGPDVLGGRVAVLRNLAGKGFGPPEDYAVGVHPTSIVFADLNQDGKTDIIASTRVSQEPQTSDPDGSGISILFGYGDGTFLTSSDYRLGAESSAGRPVVLDYRGDGRPEIVVEADSALMVLSQDP